MVWEAEVGHSERHHLRVDVDVEKVFWNAYESGSALKAAASSAGVGRSTAYRWLERRFGELRTSGMSRRRTQRLPRLSDLFTVQAEQRREGKIQAERREALTGRREALPSSRQFADVAASFSPNLLIRLVALQALDASVADSAMLVSPHKTVRWSCARGLRGHR